MIGVGKWVMLPVAVSFLALIVLRRVLGFYGGRTLATTIRSRFARDNHLLAIARVYQWNALDRTDISWV